MEQKNLARQNFVKSDVGKPKAEVLANRYGRAYDINIVPILEMVEDTRESAYKLQDLIFGSSAAIKGNIKATMVISCVDTMKARVSILNSFATCWSSGAIFIDGGNEDVFGQVMVCNPSKVVIRDAKPGELLQKIYPEIAGMVPVKALLDFIPIDLKFYANTPDQGSSRSCADLDQTMAINSLVANTMFGLVQNIMYSKPIPSNRINITLNGSTPELMTAQSLWNQALNRWDRSSRSDEINSTLMKFTHGLQSSIYDFLTYNRSVASPLYDSLIEYNIIQEKKRKAEQAQKEAELREAQRLKAIEEEKRLVKLREEEEKRVKVTKIVPPPLTPIPPLPIPAGAKETTPGVHPTVNGEEFARAA